MNKQDIATITKAAKSGGIDKAICAFLGAELEFKHAGNAVSAGMAGAVGSIRAEVEQYNALTPAAKAGVEAYKAAK